MYLTLLKAEQTCKFNTIKSDIWLTFLPTFSMSHTALIHDRHGLDTPMDLGLLIFPAFRIDPLWHCCFCYDVNASLAMKIMLSKILSPPRNGSWCKVKTTSHPRQLLPLRQNLTLADPRGRHGCRDQEQMSIQPRRS